MIRSRSVLNAMLIVLLVMSAMSLVTSQHRARKAFIEIERQKGDMRQIEQQWSQLQLEQTAAAKHSYIEKVAHTRLSMQPVTPDRTQYIVKTPEMIR
jgi:cell division protein FtsL